MTILWHFKHGFLAVTFVKQVQFDSNVHVLLGKKIRHDLRYIV